MEGVSATMYKGLRGYWKRRGYKKLNGSDSRRRKIRVSELGSTRGRRRRVWRIRIGRPKLGFLRRVPSPKKLLVWLRDAYVKMMLRFANTQVCSTGYGGGLFNDRIGSFGRAPLKEYDNKMIIEIYKSLVLAQAQAQGQLVHREPPKLSSESVASR